MQRGFLRDVGSNDVEAFLNHNFAPPSLRRDIGLLGFLHKRVLECCHPALVQALPFASGIAGRVQYHDKMLEDHRSSGTRKLGLYNRSLYKYIRMYNVLPQALVDADSVPSFQGKLTQLVKLRAQAGHEDWRDLLGSPATVAEWLYPEPPPLD